MKVSNCCDALPCGETHEDMGFCSNCHEHAVFEEEEDEQMKCRNISKDENEHSLYINPNGLCNKCMMIKDKVITKRKRRLNERG